MTPRTTRIITAALGLALSLGLLITPSRSAGSGAPAVAALGSAPSLPAYRELVQSAARASWAGQPAAAPGSRLAALVELDMAPLALVGAGWGHEQRAIYSAELAAARATVAAEVEAAGGVVLADFSHAASGMAVEVDAADIAALAALPGVAAVVRVADYATDQAAAPITATQGELATLIGADKVHRAGNDGTGIEIAIIDSGIDYTHVKLGGPGDADSYRRAACGSAAISPADPACDPTLAPPADLFPNAKVIGGRDLVGDIWPDPDPRCGTQLVCPVSDENPIDLHGHGTHVADIAAGRPITAGGADVGVAPGANLWAFKACNGAADLCNGVALLEAIDSALDLDRSDRGQCTAGPACRAYDPADIIVLALSYSYGQPEDAVSLFVNLAGFYGSFVVAAAGNDGDKPYIVGSPATAAAALAVAESVMPQPGGGAAVTAGGRTLDALHQAWSPEVAAPLVAHLRYGDGGGANADGCAPLAPWQGALLLDRGGCPTALKAANASAAGAGLVLVADNARSDAPPVLNAAAASLPVYSLSYGEGQRLQQVARSEGSVAATPLAADVERVAADASRGPRIADNAMKPDLAAPGAIISAQAGGGRAVTAFGGSSGAAPVAAGVAALAIQELEEKGALDPDPGLADAPGQPPLSLAPLVKALLMNNAFAELQAPAGGLAPFTLQGAGRVNAQAAFVGRTLALDATAMLNLLAASPELNKCTISPYRDLLLYRLIGATPPCADLYPGGDPLFQAWNAQSGSVSFGYRPTVGFQELTRQVVVVNYSRSPRSYSLSTGLRFADDVGRGVSLSASPARLELAGGDSAIVSVTLTISPRDLPEWTLNGGALGNRGSASCASTAPERDCPSLTLFEVDGALLVDGGVNNRISVPIHVLPRKVADVSVSRVLERQVLLSNRAAFQAGEVEPFALIDVSPNKCDTRSGLCDDLDYVPGSRPGSGQSPVDLRYVGLRSYSAPGLNAELLLPPAPAGALADEVVEFAMTVWDKPYRASPNFPVQFEVHIDADADGIGDYVAYNADLGGGRDGRSAVFVRDVNPSDGQRPTAPYLYSVADFNSQNWVLPVPAAAVGLRSDRPFRFYVLALDAYFKGGTNTAPWDCSPGPVNACGVARHTMQTGALRFRPGATALSVPVEARAVLGFGEDVGGVAASPSQIGLLLLFRDAQPSLEAESVRLR